MKTKKKTKKERRKERKKEREELGVGRYSFILTQSIPFLREIENDHFPSDSIEILMKRRLEIWDFLIVFFSFCLSFFLSFTLRSIDSSSLGFGNDALVWN